MSPPCTLESCVSKYGKNIFESHFVLETGANVFGEGKNLVIENKVSDKPLDIFICAGKPLNEPWKKLLGHNGFIVCKDEEEAEKVMNKVRDVGVENFSYKVL